MVSLLNFWEFERSRHETTRYSSFSTESTFFSFFFLLLTRKEEIKRKKKNPREISYVLKIEKKKQGLNEKIERSMTNELGIWENKEKETNRNTILSATYTE